jgi:hypothetical protein
MLYGLKFFMISGRYRLTGADGKTLVVAVAITVFVGPARKRVAVLTKLPVIEQFTVTTRV